MNIATWRPGLKQWLNSKMLVDTWELRNPIVYGTLNAFLPPLQNLTFMDGMVGEATAIQDIYLTSKYSGETKYDQLPIGTLEQTYSTIQRKLSLEYLSIAALSDFEMLTVPDAIQVSEDGEGMADWLVTLVFSCKLTWTPSTSLLPGDIDVPLPDINKISIGLFAGLLAPSNKEVPNFNQDFQNPTRRNKVGTVEVVQ